MLELQVKFADSIITENDSDEGVKEEDVYGDDDKKLGRWLERAITTSMSMAMMTEDVDNDREDDYIVEIVVKTKKDIVWGGRW